MNCDAISETQILQNVKLSNSKEDATISDVRYCISKINNCQLGTYITYYSENRKFVVSFICLKCDYDKFKIIKIHKFLKSIPFDVEDNIGTFHRNLNSPYFVCGDVHTEVFNCEFYMDLSNKKDPSDGRFNLNLILGTFGPLNSPTTYCVRCKKGYQGDFDNSTNTGFSKDKLFTLFNRGLISCDIPIINCEFFKMPYGLDYISFKVSRSYSQDT